MLKIVISNYYCYCCRWHVLLLLLFPSSIINLNKNNNNNNNNKCCFILPCRRFSPSPVVDGFSHTRRAREGDAAAIINCLLAAIIQQRRLLDVNIDVRLHYWWWNNRTSSASADGNIVVLRNWTVVALPYDDDAAIMMVLLEQWRLSLLPLIMLMMTIAANYLHGDRAVVIIVGGRT